MPGAAGFRLSAEFFLTDPRTATLTAADLGGLMLLLGHAWAGGGLIPSSDPDLALLSRMGEGWAGSRLRASLARFFSQADGMLESIDLADQLSHRKAVSAANRRGGKASGKSRRRRDMERTFNERSPNVQRTLDVRSFAEEEEREPEEAQTAGVQPPFSPSPAPATIICNANSPPAVVLACQDTSSEKTPIGGFRSPPHTPPIREILISPSGYGGAGGKGVEESPAQLDLFGSPIKAPGRKKARRPTQAHRDAACAIVDAYIDEVTSHWGRGRRADRNVSLWLAEGASFEDLRASVRNFARHCDRTGRDPQYRNAPANFFRRQDPLWKGYVTYEDRNAQKPNGNAGSGARVRTGADYSSCVLKITIPPAEAAPDGQPAAPDRPQPGQNPFAAALGDRPDGGGGVALAPVPRG